MLLNVVHNLVCLGKRHSYTGIGAAVINGDSARILIAKRRAGEGNVLYVAHALVNFTRIDKILFASGDNLPGLIYVQKAGEIGRAHV